MTLIFRSAFLQPVTAGSIPACSPSSETASYGSGSLSVVLGYDAMTAGDVLTASKGLWLGSRFLEP